MSTRLERLTQMDTVIRGNSYPAVQTFISRFEVAERTVYDDLKFLRERLHAPLEFDRHRHGYYYTDQTWALPTFPVTEGDLLAFFISVELAHRYLGTPFEASLRQAVDHLASILPDEAQVTVSTLVKQISVRSGATSSTDATTLLALQSAITDQRPVEILYFTASSGQESLRIVHPYHLLNMQGEWHVIAYDRLRQAIRQFSLPRIRSWRTLTNEQFVRDDAFSLQDYFSQSFQSEHGNQSTEVAIWFDSYQARYIREREYHPSQRIEEQSDGGLILRFTTGALSEVQRWVMSYGSHARLLAPTTLAHEIAEELQRSLRNYLEADSTSG